MGIRTGLNIGRRRNENTHGQILDMWFEASSKSLGFARNEWLIPAAQDVITSLYEDGDLTDALERLCEHRGHDGFTVEEVVRDLECLIEVLPPHQKARIDRLSTARALVGWQRVGASQYYEEACTDALTGLRTIEYMRTRLEEMYKRGNSLGISPAITHTLLGVDLPVSAAKGIESLGCRLAVSLRLQILFTAGETLALAHSRRYIGIIGTDDQSRLLADSFKDRLAFPENYPVDGDGLMNTELRQCRVWQENLPETYEESLMLLDTMSRQDRLPFLF